MRTARHKALSETGDAHAKYGTVLRQGWLKSHKAAVRVIEPPKTGDDGK